MNPKNQHLIRAAQAGSQEAVSAVLVSVDSQIRAAVIGAVGASSELDDAMQEARIAIARGIGGFDVGRPLGPWVQTVARNAARSLHRKKKRAPETVADIPETVAGIPENASESARVINSPEQIARLGRALIRLEADDRQVLDLRLRRGLSHQGISELLGISAGACRVRYLRALRRLRTLVGEGE